MCILKYIQKNLIIMSWGITISAICLFASEDSDQPAHPVTRRLVFGSRHLSEKYTVLTVYRSKHWKSHRIRLFVKLVFPNCLPFASKQLFLRPVVDSHLGDSVPEYHIFEETNAVRRVWFCLVPHVPEVYACFRFFFIIIISVSADIFSNVLLIWSNS